MQTQRNLFRPLADTSTHQGGMFYLDGPEESSLACSVCGEYLVRTQSGYLCCPRGHGKLLAEELPGDEPCGSWFDAE